MNNLSTSVNSNLEWRRNKVQELASQGYNQSEISRILQISQPTINRDITYLREQAKDNIKTYIDERLPEEYEKCLFGLNAITKEAWITAILTVLMFLHHSLLNAITKEAWITALNTEDKREKIQALSLAKECYSMKLDLLTNANVVDDAIRFVSDRSKEKQKSSSNIINQDDKESNEPDCDDDNDNCQLEQEGPISQTTNQIF